MYGKIKDVINKDLYQSMTSRMAHLSLLIMIVFILLMLFILYLVSAVVLISKYYKFQLTEHNGQLQMTRGLFQTKKTSISIKRIQAVIVKQPLLRGFLKIATIQLVVVSNSGEKDIEKNIVIMPVIAVSQVERFLQQFLPQIPVKTTRFKPFAYAYYYELRNATLLAIPTLAFLAWVVRSNFWFVIIVIIFGLFFWYLPAFLKARRSKVQPLNKEFIILQNNRIMTKQVNYIARSNIQYIKKRSSLWLQRKGIASLLIYVRSGNGQHIFNVTYQSDKDISTIVNWYKAKTSYNNIDQII